MKLADICKKYGVRAYSDDEWIYWLAVSKKGMMFQIVRSNMGDSWQARCGLLDGRFPGTGSYKHYENALAKLDDLAKVHEWKRVS